ncbi:MAG: hypothetical protein ACXAC6_13635 [Candidatus Hodarchaeales archaeon]|jgi:hypothetical protein
MQELSQILSKISPEVFTRHYGVSNQINSISIDSSSISIGKLPGKLICNLIRDKNIRKVTEIYLWQNKSSKPSYFPLTEELSFFQHVLSSLKNKSYGDITLIGNLPLNWDITNIKSVKIDVTNFHYTIETNERKYRLKWYSRPKKGYREFQIQKILADFKIAPRAEFLIAYNGKAIFGVYEEINDVLNLDTLTGEKYIELISEKITPDQFFLEMRIIFTDITKIISRLQEVEVSLLGKKLIQPYSPLKWQTNLIDNWKAIKRSRFFNLEEEKIMNDIYLPLLSKFLKETDSGLIHADMWMRQFGMVPHTNQLQLFDFEDMQIGPKSYDIASQLNSISQQYEYFRSKNANLSVFSHECYQTLIKNFFSTLLPKFSEITADIQYCQSLRMVHELKYLLDHQPDENWLLTFIKQELLVTLEKLRS